MTVKAIVTNGSNKDIESIVFEVVLRDSNDAQIGEVYSFTSSFSQLTGAGGLPVGQHIQISNHIDRARAGFSGVVGCSMKIASVKFKE